MPKVKKTKLKTHRGAAKRFKQRAKSVKFRRAERNHILTKNTPKQVRQRRVMGKLNVAEVKRILCMLVGKRG